MKNDNNAKFVKSPDYRRVAVNGVWGGINGLGEVKLELFEDSAALPKSIDMGSNGIAEKAEYPIERIAHIGVTIPVAVLPAIANYLLEIHREFSEQQNAMKN